jgi:hypothetical protein
MLAELSVTDLFVRGRLTWSKARGSSLATELCAVSQLTLIFIERQHWPAQAELPARHAPIARPDRPEVPSY